jgi:hypothetical protein
MAKKTNEYQVIKLLSQCGVVRARDVAARGISTAVLTRMVAAGQLARSSRGVYTLPDDAISGQRTSVDVATRLPSAVLCLLTALHHYEIGTQFPREVWAALPSRMPPPRIEYPKVRYVWMSPISLSEGVDHVTLDGVRVKMFSPAKTVADCFKFRNKLGVDVAIEALADAWRKELVTMADLWYFAKVDRVTNVMRPYLETLTS